MGWCSGGCPPRCVQSSHPSCPNRTPPRAWGPCGPGTTTMMTTTLKTRSGRQTPSSARTRRSAKPGPRTNRPKVRRTRWWWTVNRIGQRALCSSSIVYIPKIFWTVVGPQCQINGVYFKLTHIVQMYPRQQVGVLMNKQVASTTCDKRLLTVSWRRAGVACVEGYYSHTHWSSCLCLCLRSSFPGGRVLSDVWEAQAEHMESAAKCSAGHEGLLPGVCTIKSYFHTLFNCSQFRF